MTAGGWIALVVWVLLGAGFAGRGGFALSFLFAAHSVICGYALLSALIGLAGLTGRRGTVTGAAVSRRLQLLATSGDEVLVELTLRRAVPLPLLWVAVQERIGPWQHTWLNGPWLSRELTYRYTVQLSERGVYSFEEPKVWVGDPFGMVSLQRRAAVPRSEWAAAPKPAELGADCAAALARAGEREGARGRAEEDWADVRQFREGDPVSRILWKSAARYEDWLVREPQRTGAQSMLTVLVDGSEGGAEQMEARASAAAAVAVRLEATGRPFRLLDTSAKGVSGAAGYAERTWAYRLAAIQADGTLPFPEAARLFTGAGRDPIIVVCSAVDAALEKQCSRWIADRRHVVVLIGTGGGQVRLADIGRSRSGEGGWRTDAAASFASSS